MLVLEIQWVILLFCCHYFFSNLIFLLFFQLPYLLLLLEHEKDIAGNKTLKLVLKHIVEPSLKNI